MTNNFTRKILEKQSLLLKEINNSNKQSDNIIQSSLMERLIFNDKKESLKNTYYDNTIEEIEFSGNKKIASFKDLTQDVFNLLFQIKSDTVDDTKLSPIARRFNKNVVQRIRESGELDSLRLSTTGNSDESIQACSIFMNDLYDKLDSYIDDIYGDKLNEENIQKFEDILSQKKLQLKDAIQTYNVTPQNLSKDKIEKNIFKLDNDIQGLENKINNMNKEIEYQNNISKNNLQEMTNDILKHAIEDIEFNKVILNQFGVGKGSNGITNSIEEKELLVKKLKENQTIINIAKMMGRIKLSFEKNDNGKFEKNRGEIIGIECGDDLSRVLSSELSLLAIPETKPLFYAKYVQKELLQYKRAEKQKLNKGNCVILADESGSTTSIDSFGYSAFYYTKAIAISLANIMVNQNRELIYQPFSSTLGETFTLNRNTFNVDSITKLATNFLNGGTDFNLILTWAIENILKNEEYDKSDILFITDGYDTIHKTIEEEFNRLKLEKKAKCVVILLDTQECADESYVKCIADKIIKLSELGLDKMTDSICDYVI